MNYTNHITIEHSDGNSRLIVDDWELCDFLDDLFTHRDIEFDLIILPDAQGKSFYTMLFNAGVSSADLFSVLCTVPLTEIERIYALNN